MSIYSLKIYHSKKKSNNRLVSDLQTQIKINNAQVADNKYFTNVPQIQNSIPQRDAGINQVVKL